MSDNHARALAREAGLIWLEQARDAGGIIGETRDTDLFTRAIVLDAYAAGAADREDQVTALKEALWAGCELLIEAAVLFREYEGHHRAKIKPGMIGGPNAEPWTKAERNAEIAGRIETWLGAAVVIPHPVIGLALSLCQDLDELMSETMGVFDQRRAADDPLSMAGWADLIEGGALEEWLGSFDRLKAALDTMPDATMPRPSINPADALRHISELVADDLGLGVDHASFDRAAARLDELVFIPADEGVPIPVVEGTLPRGFTLPVDRELSFSMEGDQPDVVVVNGRRYTPNDRHPFGDLRCGVGDDVVRAVDDKTVETCRAKFPTFPTEGSNVRDPSVPGLMDPEVVAGLIAAAGGDKALFAVTTPDPEFSPDLPVMVNGFTFYPAPRGEG